jgi:YtkA-like
MGERLQGAAMLKHVSPFVLTAALAAALIACSNSKPTETASVGAPSTPAASTTPGAPSGAAAADPNSAKKEDLNLELAMDPAQPAPHKATKFQVKLTDGSGAPVTGAEVMASIEMKGMDMGKNEVKFKDAGGGNYAGEGKFAMAGDWDVVVTAKKGGKTAKKTFPAKSVMPKP